MISSRRASSMILTCLLGAGGTNLSADTTSIPLPVRLAVACEVSQPLEAFVVTGDGDEALDLLGAPDAIVLAGDRTLTIIDGDRTLQFSDNQVIAVEAGEVTSSDCLDFASAFQSLVAVVATLEAERTAAAFEASAQSIMELQTQLATAQTDLEAAAEEEHQLREDTERLAQERDVAREAARTEASRAEELLSTVNRHAEEIVRLRAEMSDKEQLIDRLARERLVALSGVAPAQIEAALVPDGFDADVLEKLIAASDLPQDVRETLRADLGAITEDTATAELGELLTRIRDATLDDAGASIIRSDDLSHQLDVLRAAVAEAKASRPAFPK